MLSPGAQPLPVTVIVVPRGPDSGEMEISGLTATVVADCVGSRRPADRDLGLLRMQHEGVGIVSREMVVFEWLGEAGTPLFKAVSKEFLK